ncbi:MAG TPA: SpoIID/LytB domain-containing protein [Terriglobales bacterium]
MRLAQNVAPIANQNNHVMLDPEKAPAEESPDAIRAHVRPEHTLLHGYVGDEEFGTPLSGAMVQIGSVQTQTDARGHYFISVPTPPMGKGGPEPLTLRFQKPGYKTVVIENFAVSSEDMEKNMSMEVGHGEIRSVAPEGPGSGTAPMDPSQKGQTEISPQLYRWAQQSEMAQSFAVVVPSTVMLGTGGPHNPTQAYEPCSGRYTCTNVFTYTLETYVTNGLPSEWLNWWDINSQEAGAVAYRSYGAWFVANKACPSVGAHNGQCRVTYDICNSTACQAYNPKDKGTSRTSITAVSNTTGVVLSQDGTNIFFAEYAGEENWASSDYSSCNDGQIGEPNNPTNPWPCMYDLVGTGHSQPDTHSRGMSQRGSQRWASGNDWTGGDNDTHNPILNSLGQPITKRDWRCILDHYYNANSNSKLVDPIGTGNPGAGSELRTAYLQGPTQGPTPLPYGQIAYETGVQDIRAANVADKSNDRLIATPGWYPSWEPGGRRLAYQNLNGIGIINADGTQPIQLTNNPNDRAVAWSPLGDRLAFCSARSGVPDIWLVKPDGTGLQQVTHNLNLLMAGGNAGYETEDCYIRWSPDGTKLAYTGVTASDPLNSYWVFNVYTIDLNDPNLVPVQLTHCQINPSGGTVTVCSLPSWSPDGKKIAFSDSDTPVGDNIGGGGIYIMNPDGTEISPVYQTETAWSLFPQWSTDGKKIFFMSNPGGSTGVYSIDTDRTNMKLVLGGSKARYQPGGIDIERCARFDQ